MSKTDDNYETILQRFNTNREKLAQYKTGLSSFMKNYEYLLGDKDKEDLNFKPAYCNNLNNSTHYNLKFKSPILSPRERKDNLFDNIDNALTRLKKKYNFEPNMAQIGKNYLKRDDDDIDPQILDHKHQATDDIVEKIKQRVFGDNTRRPYNQEKLKVTTPTKRYSSPPTREAKYETPSSSKKCIQQKNIYERINERKNNNASLDREEHPNNKPKNPISILIQNQSSSLQKMEESQFQKKEKDDRKYKIEEKFKNKNGNKLADLKKAYFDKNFANMLSSSSSESDKEFEKERKIPKSPIFKKVEESDLFLSSIKRSGSRERNRDIPFEQCDMLSSAKRHINFELDLSYSRNSSFENEKNLENNDKTIFESDTVLQKFMIERKLIENELEFLKNELRILES